jgi:shikimate kinase
MKTNIALIGFMGAGKTVVGKVLAQRQGREFIETDLLIERRAGKSIAEIFREDGELRFREIELDIIRDISWGENQVIACGGGVVLNKINIDRLKKKAVIVYMAASPRAIIRRTAQDRGVRPLLNVDDRAGEIRELLRFRRPLYENAADITINTSSLGINAVVNMIIAELKRYEGSDK